MTTEVAASACAKFIAIIGAKLGFDHCYKPCIIRSDQGSAFISTHFLEFAASLRSQLTYSATYTPQQNSHIERHWGMACGTARVFLAAANLPPSFHPFAMQTAEWLINQLPRQSRGRASLYILLTRTLPSLEHLYSFGCLCAATIPERRWQGDKHFSHCGEYALYLGPSAEVPGHVVFMLITRKVQVVAKLRVWEEKFP